MKKKYLAFSIFICFVIAVQVQAQYTKLVDFTSVTKGDNPQSTPLIAGNVLYGMTLKGGTKDLGCIYKVNPDGTGFTKLFNFTGTATGSYPIGPLVLSGSYLYGGTHKGGASDEGCLFKINIDGTGFTKLLDFSINNGSQNHGLIISGNVIYGEAHEGGLYGKGCIFSLNTDGSGYTKLHEFNETDGDFPGNTLTLSGSVLYGVTLRGGAHTAGTIFKINTDGSGFTTMHNFNTTDGKAPWGYLTLSGDVLYGATWVGGLTGNGVIYKINTDGSGFSKLMDFNNTNGSQPWSVSLSLSGKVLYGITIQGGDSSKGCIYKVNTNGGGYCKILDFHGADNGSMPQSDLLLDGNTLYGTTSKGGTSGMGVLFKYVLPAYFPCDTMLYDLTVNGGSGSGAYASGSAVTVTADTPAVGKKFDKWTGDVSGIADVNSSTTTFTMPSANASITATYVDVYVLTVTSGSGSGSYTAGTSVVLIADSPPAGRVFGEWTGDITGIANIYASPTTYTMPASDASITAIYDTVIVIISAFSPNGDGVNESWHIDEMTDPAFTGTIQVFNRWGYLVYDFSKTHLSWNGSDLRGASLPVESYHYVIDYKNGTKPKKGIVTIVR